MKDTNKSLLPKEEKLKEAAKDAVSINFPNPAIIWADNEGKKFKELLIETLLNFSKSEAALEYHQPSLQSEKENGINIIDFILRSNFIRQSDGKNMWWSMRNTEEQYSSEDLYNIFNPPPSKGITTK